MTGFAPKASALRPIVEIVHDIDLKSDWLTGVVALGRLLVFLRWRVTNPILVAATAVIGIVALPVLRPGWVFVK